MTKKGSLLREIPIIIGSALLVSIIVKTFFLHFFFIPSGSMENTLQIGDRIAVNKFSALFSEIKRGEVVVFADPDNWLGQAPDDQSNGLIGQGKNLLITLGVVPDPAKQYLIKRVIGVGGDTVICCDDTGKLQVNGASIAEPYVYENDKPSESNFNITVPQGYIWVMGDHRSASADSRFHTDDVNKGMVPLTKVVGRAALIVWPLDNLDFLEKAKDLGKLPVKSTP